MISANITPSEVAIDNILVAQIFNRYGISPYEKNYSISTLTTKKGIVTNFLMDILNTIDPTEQSEIKRFDKYNVLLLIDYLERSHDYYLEKKLPEIEQTINILLNNYIESSAFLLDIQRDFYLYCTSLRKHIMEEERKLFPYAKQLYYKMVFPTLLDHPNHFSLQYYIKNHSDTETALRRMKESIASYSPVTTNESRYRILIMQMENFEQDLNLHALIEDKVLVPKLLKLERNMNLSLN